MALRSVVVVASSVISAASSLTFTATGIGPLRFSFLICNLSSSNPQPHYVRVCLTVCMWEKVRERGPASASGGQHFVWIGTCSCWNRAALLQLGLVPPPCRLRRRTPSAASLRGRWLSSAMAPRLPQSSASTSAASWWLVRFSY